MKTITSCDENKQKYREWGVAVEKKNVSAKQAKPSYQSVWDKFSQRGEPDNYCNIRLKRHHLQQKD